MAVAGFLGYVLFPPQRVAINADGEQILVVSRSNELGEVIQLAGVQRDQGDVVVRSAGALTVERASPVNIAVDGARLAWRTRAPTVLGLLDEVDVAVGPFDAVMVNGLEVGVRENLYGAGVSPAELPAVTGAAPALPPLEVAVRRAVPVTILEDGAPVTIESSRLTVKAALDQAGVKLGRGDIVEPDLAAAVTPGIEVQVRHARAVAVRIGSATETYYTHKQTLGEALAEAGIGIGGDDRVEPGVEAAVANGMTARLVRVAGRTFVERETIEHRTVFKPDENLAGSNTRIVQGHDGVRVREYRVAIEDGVERERRLIEDRMSPEVQDTVIYYPAATLRAAGLSTETFKVDRTEHMYATWYNAASSGKADTDPAYGITATGLPLIKGMVAVDPRVIPLGTRLYVPGYGFAVAVDTGGGIVGNMIDLGYPDGVQVDWRTGWVDVYILQP